MSDLPFSSEQLNELAALEENVMNEFFDEQAANPDNVTLELILPKETVVEILESWNGLHDGDLQSMFHIGAFLGYIIDALERVAPAD